MKLFQIKKCSEDGSYCVYALKSNGTYGKHAKFEDKKSATDLLAGTEYDDLTDVKPKTTKESKKKTGGNTNQ